MRARTRKSVSVETILEQKKEREAILTTKRELFKPKGTYPKKRKNEAGKNEQ